MTEAEKTQKLRSSFVKELNNLINIYEEKAKDQGIKGFWEEIDNAIRRF